ncbi:hypothetical protein EH151_16295 [Elizabethkingia anophelis]|uniref:hypothetical protein n=1 Tax=Elizabethkingia anophelis TaxID=1117645 RepID=UPI00136C7B9F|nr:hypothetical protein [Elizabethkingia anophelis]MCT4237490.1 hypothetical protein [Elizabethkingia anophelis]MYZ61442.1 hypothetical protein [Elizabethkingia anophelis]
MEWKKFEEKQIELPELAINSMLDGFSIATKNLANLVIQPINNVSRLSSKLNTMFQYEILLVSEKLPDYRFSVFQFGYEINIYPVHLYISTNVIDNFEEKDWLFHNQTIYCENEEILKKEIKNIFDSKKFTEIVSGLMKIANNQV